MPGVGEIMEHEEDWGSISDSDLLDIQSEHFCTEVFSQPSCSSATGDTHNNSPSALTASLHTMVEKFKQSPVKRNEETGVKRKRDADDDRIPPLRFGKRYLGVSLLSEQTWCEKKVVYGILKPQIRKREKQRIEVQTGTSIHLARELEVHDVVPISIQSHEDAVSISLINMLSMIPCFETGLCVREFPVFGIVEGVYLKGVIDELSYNQKGELVLKELKTRRQNSLPGASQAHSHHFQLEYCHQASTSIIDNVLVPFDESQLRAELQRNLEYWRGQREPKGVDIEEAWKCTWCTFVEICDWKKNRSQVPESFHMN
ncbi:exonuclease V isoform X3 [Silurus meridionalis]|uniref:exonuclease V isoform X3 n=1 Tax=Silurus meridionalis TaxID=175797 RepID=UPI001EEB378F|nr:exonuclease V isoform X3 [Silurus meridionalis]